MTFHEAFKEYQQTCNKAKQHGCANCGNKCGQLIERVLFDGVYGPIEVQEEEEWYPLNVRKDLCVNMDREEWEGR